MIDIFFFACVQDKCLAALQLLVKQCRWDEGLEIWKLFYSFDHKITPSPERIPTDEELYDICHSVHWPGNKTDTKFSTSGSSSERFQKLIYFLLDQISY